MNPTTHTLAAVAVLTCLVGCGGSSGPADWSEGPHGGSLLRLPDGQAYVELVLDTENTAMTVHVLDADLKPLPIQDAPTLTVDRDPLPSVADASTTTGDGSSAWVFVSPALDKMPHGDLALMIGGKKVEKHIHPEGAGAH